MRATRLPPGTWIGLRICLLVLGMMGPRLSPAGIVALAVLVSGTALSQEGEQPLEAVHVDGEPGGSAERRQVPKQALPFAGFAQRPVEIDTDAVVAGNHRRLDPFPLLAVRVGSRIWVCQS